jgi:hypothetical protein
MIYPLSVLVAGPEEVTIGGVEYLAPKLRVRDVGTVERWLRKVAPDPVDDPRTSADDWPPRMGSPAGKRLLATTEGLARVLHASLGQRDATLTVEDCRGLVGKMDDVEVAEFLIAVFPVPAPDPGPSGNARPMDWHAHIRWLIDRHKWTMDYCLDMAIDQFLAAFEGPESGRGGPGKRRWDIPLDPRNAGAQVDALMEEYRAKGTLKGAVARANVERLVEEYEANGKGGGGDVGGVGAN